MNPNEKNREVLQKAIDSMSKHKAPEGLWKTIEKSLNNPQELGEKNLKNAIGELPNRKPERDLWKGIESNITPSKTRKLFLEKHVLKIAASLILLLSITFLIKNQIQHKEVIEITTAIIEDNPFTSESLIENCSANQKEIDRICSNLPAACEDPVVQELKEQLNEVNQEYNELKSMISNTSSPDLVKFLHRIENEKCQIENQLLELIVNS